MLFDNNDMDYEFFDLINLTNNNVNLTTTKEGFLKGNMFKDEYKPYKNLTFMNISPKNDREAKLWNIMQYEFAINDLNLYLDVHPDNREVLNVLKKNINELKKEKEEFIKLYGPLQVCDTLNTDETFKWINNPWPWDDLGGGMYV